MASKVIPETVEIDLSAMTAQAKKDEVQVIDILPAADYQSSFRLGIDGVMTGKELLLMLGCWSCDLSVMTSSPISDSLSTGCLDTAMAAVINRLPTVTPDKVSIKRTDINGGHRYTVTFLSSETVSPICSTSLRLSVCCNASMVSDRGSWPQISYLAEEPHAITIKVKRAKAGVASGQELILEMDGIPTKPLRKASTAAQV